MVVIINEPFYDYDDFEEMENNNEAGDGELIAFPEINAFGSSFRDYQDQSQRQANVENLYKKKHTFQTYEFVNMKKEEYGRLDKRVMNIWDCCNLLHEFIDESDPDFDESEMIHLLQTAEAIRSAFPNQDWLHLTALIHGLGKVMLHPLFGGQPQWCTVGDTYPLGCAFSDNIVHFKHFAENPDLHNPEFTTRLGIYTEKCGLDKVTMSWGHDEYMYMVAKGNNTTLPPVALFIIRFHSFFALHRDGAYKYLMNDEDKTMLKWLKIFVNYDLYNKGRVNVDVEAVKPYYISLINKYFPTLELRW